MKNFLLLFAVGLFLSSCSNNQTTEDTTQAEEPTEVAAPIMITDQISSEGTINMTPTDLWTEVAAFSGAEKLFPDMFASSSIEGTGLGALRTCVLADGTGEILEEITNIDEENMILEYKVVSAPFAVSDITGTMQVIPIEGEENNCILKWSTSYQVDESTAANTKEEWQGFQQMGIANWNKLALASVE